MENLGSDAGVFVFNPIQYFLKYYNFSSIKIQLDLIKFKKK